MKIDKAKLKELTELSDEALWREICKAASSHGISMPDRTPSKSELGRVRDALSDAEKLSLGTAIKLVNELKRGE